jgi:hypothetical protein
VRFSGDCSCAAAAAIIHVRAGSRASEITEAAASRDASSGNAALEDAIPRNFGSSPDELSVKSSTSGLEFLDDHLALGVGMTVQYDGSRGTDLGIASWSFRQDRFELAAFRFVSEQTRRRICLSEPNFIENYDRSSPRCHATISKLRGLLGEISPEHIGLSGHRVEVRIMDAVQRRKGGNFVGQDT